MSFKLGFKRVHRVSQADNRRETVPTSRTGSRECTIAKVSLHPPHTEISPPMIVAVIRTRRNQSRRSNRAGTLEQLHEVKERRVGRACTRCGMGLATSGEHHGGAA